MEEIAIRVESLSKKFKIGSARSGSFRESVSLFLRKKHSDVQDEFLALDDVSFEIDQGDAIGIIGRNGAGKSTLLKILSRITEPTLGRVELYGRVASLLEVGTGFHPELTGRENIYLNGTILGMSRREVKAKFDEIVDFSGVSKFIDTPVKRYSSGMYVRLAFAVAAHLEPEILIVDEVLAVGDAAFQRKCLGKMGEVSKMGRTVILVSHNISQVQTLCNKGILLDSGKLIKQGDIGSVINEYTVGSKGKQFTDLKHHPRLGVKSDDFSYTSLAITSKNGDNVIREGEEIRFTFEFETTNSISELVTGFAITDAIKSVLIECRSTASIDNLTIKESGRYQLISNFKPNLKTGIYNLNIGARSLNGSLEYLESVAVLEILPRKDEAFEKWNTPSNGIVITPSSWQLIN